MSENIDPPASLPASQRLRGEFHAIERRYTTLVFGTALRCLRCREMAQEVTQDVFLLLAKKGAGVPHENPAGWLHRTAVLKARERLRAENRYRRRVAEYAQAQEHGEAPTAFPAQPEVEMEHILERLDGALNRLPERDRRIIFLRYFEGLDARAMAKRLGITAEAAQKQCERARSRLAEKLAITAVLTTGVLRAQLAAGGAAAPSAFSSRPPSSPPANPGCSTHRRLIPILGTAAGIIAAAYFLPSRQMDGSRYSQPSLTSATQVGDLSPAVRTAGALPAANAANSRSRTGGGELDLAALAALLERADGNDSAAAAAAEAMLAGHGITSLSIAVDRIPDLPLPPNQLRVLALGVLQHLVTRDGCAAVLAGERLWRAQHGASAPLLAGLVNEGLTKWHLEDRAAAVQWYEKAAAEGLFEDRGQPNEELEDDSDFQQAADLERTARDLRSRRALAEGILLKTRADAPSWRMMTEVWTYKLPPGDARELADALWSRNDLPALEVFQFRQALVTLPTVAPSLESLRWAATPPGREDMDAVFASSIVRAWQQRHPGATVAWLATLHPPSAAPAP